MSSPKPGRSSRPPTLLNDSAKRALSIVFAVSIAASLGGVSRTSFFVDASAASAATICPPVHGIGLTPGAYAMEGVVTIAGISGSSGYTDSATDRFAAQFNSPRYVLFHALSGTLYVSDSLNHRLRTISPHGAVATLAGSGTAGSVDSTNPLTARFNEPAGTCVSYSNAVMLVAGALEHKIRDVAIGASNAVDTASGTGSAGSTNGGVPILDPFAKYSEPRGIACNDVNGYAYIADTGNGHIRRLRYSDYTVSTLATGLSSPVDITWDPVSTSLYVADSGAGRLYLVHYTSGTKTDHGAYAGVAGIGGNWNSVPSTSSRTRALFAASSTGYTAATKGVTSSATAPTVIAGVSGTPGAVDDSSDALAGRFQAPKGVAVAARSGGFYVADEGDHTIRAVIGVFKSCVVATETLSLSRTITVSVTVSPPATSSRSISASLTVSGASMSTTATASISTTATMSRSGRSMSGTTTASTSRTASLTVSGASKSGTATASISTTATTSVSGLSVSGTITASTSRTSSMSASALSGTASPTTSFGTQSLEPTQTASGTVVSMTSTLSSAPTATATMTASAATSSLTPSFATRTQSSSLSQTAPTPSLSRTQSATRTGSPSVSPAPTAMATPSFTVTMSMTATRSTTSTPTVTRTKAVTGTVIVQTRSPTRTPIYVPLPTATASDSPSRVPTRTAPRTPTVSATVVSHTLSPAPTETLAPSSTVHVVTPPQTPSAVATLTLAPVPTSTAEHTRTVTGTITAAPTATRHQSPTGHAVSPTSPWTPTRELEASTTAVVAVNPLPPDNRPVPILFEPAFASWTAVRHIAPLPVATDIAWNAGPALQFQWLLPRAAAVAVGADVGLFAQQSIMLTTGAHESRSCAPLLQAPSNTSQCSLAASAAGVFACVGEPRHHFTGDQIIQIIRIATTLPLNQRTAASARASNCDPAADVAQHTVIAVNASASAYERVQRIYRAASASASTFDGLNASAVAMAPWKVPSTADGWCGIDVIPALSGSTSTSDLTDFQHAVCGAFPEAPTSDSVVVGIGTTASCSIADTAGFVSRRGHGASVLGQCTTPAGATCTTVAQVHVACAAEPDCEGYETTAIAQPRGAGLSSVVETAVPTLFRTGVWAEPDATEHTSSVFHRKPVAAARTCSFVASTATNGTDTTRALQVYVSQTAWASQQVVVSFRNGSTGLSRTVSVCGGSKPFAAREGGRALFGSDDQCGQFVLCAEIPGAMPGSRVSATVPAGVQRRKCTFAAQFVVTSTSVPRTSVALAPPRAAPSVPSGAASIIDARPFPQLTLSGTAGARDTLLFRAIVRGARAVGVKVRQTAFDCRDAHNTATWCAVNSPAPITVTFSPTAGASATVSRSCGGIVGFNGRPGASFGTASCGAVELDCGAPLHAAGSGGFTGIVEVVVAASALERGAGEPTTLLDEASGTCVAEDDEDDAATFHGTVFAMPWIGTSNATVDAAVASNASYAGAAAPSATVSLDASLAVFPLGPIELHRNAPTQPSNSTFCGSSSDTTDRLFLLQPVTNLSSVVAASSAAVAVAVDSVALDSGAQLAALTTCNAGRPLAAFIAALASPNLTAACVADVVPAGGHSCTVPIPPLAERVAIQVAQIDLRHHAVTVRFVDAAGAAVAVPSTCGGPSSLSDTSGTTSTSTRFYGDEPGREGACDLLATCTDVFVPSDAVTIVVAGDGRMEAVGECGAAMDVRVAFSTPAVSRRIDADDVPSGAFLCPTDHSLVSRQDLCDGLTWGCPDGADERCGVFVHAAEAPANLGSVPFAAVASAPFEVSSTRECLQESVANASVQAFSVSASNTSIGGLVCTLYSSMSADALTASSVIVWLSQSNRSASSNGDATTRVYIAFERLPQGSPTAQTLPVCTDVLSCSGNGDVVLTDGTTTVVASQTACRCQCQRPWTGDRCAVEGSLGAASAYYAVVPGMTPPFVPAVFERAITVGYRGVTASVQQLVPFNGSSDTVAIAFSLTPLVDASVVGTLVAALRVENSSQHAAVNAELASQGFDRIAVFLIADGSSTYSSAGVVCDAAAGSCTVTGSPLMAESLRLSAYGFAVPDGNLSVTLETADLEGETDSPTSVRRRTGSAQEVNFTCVSDMLVQATSASSTSTEPGCTSPAFSCSTPRGLGLEQLTSTSPTTVTVRGMNVTTPTCATGEAAVPNLAASVQNESGLPTLRSTNTASDRRVIRSNGVLAGAVTTVALGLAAAFGVAGLGHGLRELMRKARGDLSGSRRRLSGVVPWAAEVGITDLALKRRSSVLGRMLDVAVGVGLAGALSLGIMGLLWLIFHFTRAPQSDEAIVLRYFATAGCEGGTHLSVRPFQAVAIEAHGSCAALRMAGETSGALYGRARCSGGGAVTVQVAFADADCPDGDIDDAFASGSVVPVRESECLPARTLHASSVTASAAGNTEYVVATCVALGVAGSYLDALSALAAAPAQDVAATAADASAVQRPNASFGDPVDVGRQGTAAHAVPYYSLFTTGTSTSRFPGTVASASSTSSVELQGLSKARVITQPRPALPTAGNGSAAVLIVNAMQANASTAAASSLWWQRLPRTVVSTTPCGRNVAARLADAPLGHLFGYYDPASTVSAANELPGALAARTAQRYVDVKATDLDLGARATEVFAAADDGDDAGVTVGVWVRATERTVGAVWALADLFEVGGASPIIERLLALSRDGPTTSRPWFTDTFSVYASLVIDGRSQALTFAMLEPESGSSSGVTLRRWSLAELQQLRLLDGGWHHVAVSFQEALGEASVTVAIDGVTKPTASTWRRCLPRLPRPVRDLGESSTLRLTVDPERAALGRKGVLYVGYFNGAAGQLRIEARPFDAARTMREESTYSMRALHGLQRTSFTVIAGLGLCAAIVATCVLAVTIGALRGNILAAQAEERAETEEAYLKAAPILFGFAAANAYAILPFDVLARLLSTSENSGDECPPGVVAEFLRECLLREKLTAKGDMTVSFSGSTSVLFHVPHIVRACCTALQRPNCYLRKEFEALDLGFRRQPTPEQWEDMFDMLGVDVIPVPSQPPSTPGAALVASSSSQASPGLPPGVMMSVESIKASPAPFIPARASRRAKAARAANASGADPQQPPPRPLSRDSIPLPLHNGSSDVTPASERGRLRRSAAVSFFREPSMVEDRVEVSASSTVASPNVLSPLEPLRGQRLEAKPGSFVRGLSRNWSGVFEDHGGDGGPLDSPDDLVPSAVFELDLGRTRSFVAAPSSRMHSPVNTARSTTHSRAQSPAGSRPQSAFSRPQSPTRSPALAVEAPDTAVEGLSRHPSVGFRAVARSLSERLPDDGGVEEPQAVHRVTSAALVRSSSGSSYSDPFDSPPAAVEVGLGDEVCIVTSQVDFDAHGDNGAQEAMEDLNGVDLDEDECDDGDFDVPPLDIPQAAVGISKADFRDDGDDDDDDVGSTHQSRRGRSARHRKRSRPRVDKGEENTARTGNGADEADLGSSLAPVFFTLQVTAIYAGAGGFPSVYRAGFFGGIFRFLTLRFLEDPSIHPLLVPIAMMALVIVALGVLAFVLVTDDRAFYRNALRYAVCRNRVEGHAGALGPPKKMIALLRKVAPEFVYPVPFVQRIRLCTMPTLERVAIALFRDDGDLQELKLKHPERPPAFVRKGSTLGSLTLTAEPDPALKLSQREVFTCTSGSVAAAASTRRRRRESNDDDDDDDGPDTVQFPPSLLPANPQDAEPPTPQPRPEPAPARAVGRLHSAAHLPREASMASPLVSARSASQASLYSMPASPTVSLGGRQLGGAPLSGGSNPAVSLHTSIEDSQPASPLAHFPPASANTMQLPAPVLSTTWRMPALGGVRSGPASAAATPATQQGLRAFAIPQVMSTDDFDDAGDDGALTSNASWTMSLGQARFAESPSRGLPGKPAPVPADDSFEDAAPPCDATASAAETEDEPPCNPDTASASRSFVATENPAALSDAYETNGRPLAVLHHTCPVHCDLRLVATAQSKVAPYRNRRACCVATDGFACGTTLGELFKCPHRDDVTGHEDCAFAVCAEHFRSVPYSQRVVCRVAGAAYRVALRPPSWWAGVAVVSLAVGVYYPVVTTALKVLSCHTSYQCIFDGGCWASPSASFVAAAYLAALVLLVYGIGFPVAVFIVLTRRERVLHKIFLAAVYRGGYAEQSEDPAVDATEGESWTQRLVRRFNTATSASSSHEEPPPPPVRNPAATVAPNEYARFLETDTSTLAQLYGNVAFTALSFTVITQFGRVLLIIPPIVATPGSLTQIACIVAGEVFFFAIVVLRDPFISLWLKVIHLLGAVHQLLIVSLQAYVIAVSHERDVSGAAGNAMVSVTSIYVVVVVGIIGFMTGSDFIVNRRARNMLRDVLRRVSFSCLQDSPLLLLPVAAGALETQLVTGDDEADFSDFGASEIDDDDSGDHDDDSDSGSSSSAAHTTTNLRRSVAKNLSASKRHRSFSVYRSPSGIDDTPQAASQKNTHGHWRKHKTATAEFVRYRRQSAAGGEPDV